MNNLGKFEQEIIQNANHMGGVNQPIPIDLHSGLYISKAGARQFPRGFSYNPDVHSHWEWGAVLEGEMTFKMDEKYWRVPAGSGYLLRPGAAVQAQAIQAPFLVWLEISGHGVTSALEDIMDGQSLRLDKYTYEQLYSAIKIPSLLHEKPLGYNFLANSYLWRFLAYLFYPPVSGDAPISADIRKVINHIGQADFSYPMSLADLATVAKLKTETFRKRFETETGISPTQYVIRQRMRRAKSLMDDESRSLADISLLVGIENPYYFSRLFHKQEGMSPSAYRRRFFPEQGT